MRGRQRKRPMGEINVVPYIDVMLVLLVIFMITAPMLSEGIKVELPQVAESKPTEQSDIPPLVIAVEADGRYGAEHGTEILGRGLELEELVAQVMAVRRLQPKTPVYLKGDQSVNYGRVVNALAMLQTEGVADVGLLTEPMAE